MTRFDKLQEMANPMLRVQQMMHERMKAQATMRQNFVKGDKGEPGQKGDPGVTPVKGVDYFTEEEIAKFLEYIRSQVFVDHLKKMVKNGADGKNGRDGNPGINGKDGADGKPGYTPVAGVDYWTEKDRKAIMADVAKIIPRPAEPKYADVSNAVAAHIGDIKKNLPTNDSVVTQLLKHPLLRVLMHGGGGTSTGSATTFVENEVVAGSGTAWTLAGTPTSGSLKLYVNGQRLTLTVDYTVVGTAITTLQSFSAGTVLADYRQ